MNLEAWWVFCSSAIFSHLYSGLISLYTRSFRISLHWRKWNRLLQLTGISRHFQASWPHGEFLFSSDWNGIQCGSCSRFIGSRRKSTIRVSHRGHKSCGATNAERARLTGGSGHEWRGERILMMTMLRDKQGFGWYSFWAPLQLGICLLLKGAYWTLNGTLLGIVTVHNLMENITLLADTIERTRAPAGVKRTTRTGLLKKLKGDGELI